MSRQEKQQDNVPQKISSSLLENLVYLRKQFDGSMDFIIRQFNIEGTAGHDAFLCQRAFGARLPGGEYLGEL